jgi:hypothetical protein
MRMTAWRGCGVLLIAALCAAALPACRRSAADDAGTASAANAGARPANAPAAGAPSAGGPAAPVSHAGGAGGVGGAGAVATPGAVAAGSGTDGTAAQKVLAEVVNRAAALTVQVVEAQRVTPDTVRIEIALINTSSAPEPLDVARVLSGRHAATLTPADLCLLTADGSRRLFVLRDAANAPMMGGGFAPLKPGERRVVWAVFPSPSAASDPATPRVNVVLAGMVLRNVPISPAPAEAGAS